MQEKSLNYGNCLKYWLFKKGLNQSQFAEISNHKVQQINQLIHKANWGTKTVEWVTDSLNISIEEFISAEEKENLANDHPQLPENPSNSVALSIAGKPIPYYSVDVTAGNVTLFDDTNSEIPSAYYYLPAFQDCVAVSVKGESMLGRYNPGDIIFIKEVHYWKGSGILDFGNVYLIFTRDGLRVIKRVRKATEKAYWKLCSENPEYDDFEIEVSSVYRVFEVKGKLQQNAM